MKQFLYKCNGSERGSGPRSEGFMDSDVEL